MKPIKCDYCGKFTSYRNIHHVESYTPMDAFEPNDPDCICHKCKMSNSNDKIMYKIFDIRDRKPCTLFHGIDGSRTMPLDTWIEADIKQVKDGTSKTSYESGFHVLYSKEEAEKYLEKFNNISNRIVAPVEICTDGRCWPKEHSRSNVLLVQYIRINSTEWDKALMA